MKLLKQLSKASAGNQRNSSPLRQQDKAGYSLPLRHYSLRTVLLHDTIELVYSFGLFCFMLTTEARSWHSSGTTAKPLFAA